MKILVDADASPKKDAIIKAAHLYDLKVILVSSISHYSTKELPDRVERVWVDIGSDVADFKIVQLASPSDIVVTGDYGLASMLLPKGCRVLHHDGYEYTVGNIQRLIDSRHLASNQRRTSQRVRVKSMDPFAGERQLPFEELLDKSIQAHLGEAD